MSKFPAVAYHEDGSHVVVQDAEQAKKLGGGYSDTPNDKTHKAARKAAGAAKTDLQPGQFAQTVESY